MRHKLPFKASDKDLDILKFILSNGFKPFVNEDYNQLMVDLFKLGNEKGWQLELDEHKRNKK